MPKSSSNQPSSSGFIDANAASAAGSFTDLIFYSLDSAKVRMQAGQSIGRLPMLFKGMLPTILSGSMPSNAIFFATFTPLKNALAEQTGTQLETANVLLASAVAGLSCQWLRMARQLLAFVCHPCFTSLTESESRVYFDSRHSGIADWRAIRCHQKAFTPCWNRRFLAVSRCSNHSRARLAWSNGWLEHQSGARYSICIDSHVSVRELRSSVPRCYPARPSNSLRRNCCHGVRHHCATFDGTFRTAAEGDSQAYL